MDAFDDSASLDVASRPAADASVDLWSTWWGDLVALAGDRGEGPGTGASS